jgi:O-succinylbenzoic acid--CoA ligase
LTDWLSLRARTHGDHPAVALPRGGELTYSVLDREASSFADRLEPGVRLIAKADAALPPMLHGAVRGGAVLYPTDRRAPIVEAPDVGAQPGDTVLFTSGTAGVPKPVILTQANHEASAIASAWNLGVAPDDRWLCVLPMHHVGGLAILWRCAIYGITAVVRDQFDAAEAAELVEAGEVTLASLVPTMLRRMRDAGLRGPGRLRAVLLGGGPVPRDLLEWSAAIGLPVLQTYGMTETASQVVTLSAEEALHHHGSAGRPLLGVELRIGDGGEILVRGPMVARGAVHADGWLHTRDRGRLDEDGFLHVEGRLDDVIVTGGENVMAGEVEEALLAHPAVADAAVAGRPDPEWGSAVTAWVVLATHVPDGELAAHCRARIAAHKVPKAFVRVRELPRNAAGKVVRRELRAQA